MYHYSFTLQINNIQWTVKIVVQMLSQILFMFAKKNNKIWFVANGWTNIMCNACCSTFADPNKAFVTCSCYITCLLTHSVCYVDKALSREYTRAKAEAALVMSTRRCKSSAANMNVSLTCKHRACLDPNVCSVKATLMDWQPMDWVERGIKAVFLGSECRPH